MKKKERKLSPVRVVNPTGDNHLVHLSPNQDFVLVLSDWFGMMDYDYHSDYFTVGETEQLRDGTLIIHFHQNFDMSQWAKVSSFYLGDVLVIGSDTAASLCVMLHSEKTDVLTVINPTGTEIKVQPHQVVEVVIYDKAHNKWVCKTVPGHEDVQFTQIGYEEIQTDTDVNSLLDKAKGDGNKFFVFPRAFDDYEGTEHHYWFEINADNAKRITDWKTGVYKGGRIMFEPVAVDGPEHTDTRVLHLNMSVRGHNKKKLRTAMGTRRHTLPDSLPFESGMSDDSVLLPRVISDDDDDFDNFQSGHAPGGHHRTTFNQTTIKKPQVFNNAGYYTGKPLVTSVIITEKVLADTMDPLFVGTTVTEQSEVNMTQTNKQKWHGAGCGVY